MKKILPFITILIFAFGYSQPKGMELIEGFQEKPIKVIAHVQSKQGEFVILQPYNSKVSYYSSNTNGLEPEKQYVFWVRIIGCQDCRTKEVEILEADLTSKQAQKDQAEAAKRIAEKYE